MTIKLFHRRARHASEDSCARTARAARAVAAGVFGLAAIEALEARQLLAVDIAVNTAQRFQQIDGFGTSVASYVGGLYNSAWSDMYYQDLGSSMLRMDLNVNALRGPDNDLATPVAMVEDINQNIAQFDFHNSRVQPFGDVAKASLTKKLDEFKLIASMWSPPHWMKGPELDAQTGKLNGKQPTIAFNGFDAAGGTLIDTPENLQQFSRYVAAYVKGFQQTYGVPLYAISIQNELAFDEPYSSCVYTAPLYVKTIKAVHDAFVHYGLDTKIEGPEDVGVGSITNVGILSRQYMYLNAVRNDPEAMKDLDIYSIHGYANDASTSGRSPEMWKEYFNGRQAGTYPAPNWTGIKGDSKSSWMTETSGEAHTMDGGLELGGKTLDALVQGNVSAYVYWQTSMSQTTYDNQALTAGTDTADKKYNVARQLFRYIRPGAYRVSATPTDPTGVYVASFTHEQQRTITTVLENLSNASQDVNLTVTGGSGLTGYQIARRTSATENFADIGAVALDANGVAHLTLPAKSVVTLQGTFTPPDLTSPKVQRSSFDYDAAQKLNVQFSENVTGVSASDLVVENLTDPTVTASAADVTMTGGDSATFTFSPAVLPDGNYRASLPSGSVQDTAGNDLAPGGRAEFFVLGGDANRDRVVDLSDFTFLVSSFNQSGRTFSQGDFDYSGKVDLTDFTILTRNFNKSLPPPVTAAASASRKAARVAAAPKPLARSSSSPTFSDRTMRDKLVATIMGDATGPVPDA